MERIELARLLGWRGDCSGAQANRSFSPSSAAELRSWLAEAAAGEGNVFLFDRTWGAGERARAEALLAEPDRGGNPARGWLCLPTGGSSGGVKFARHDQDTLSAAAAGFRGHFSLRTVNAVGILPLHHVSGFMAWIRCELSGGRYIQADWKGVERGEFPSIAGDEWVISLVPTQLQRLLASEAASDWLRRFRCVLLGGGPSWPALLNLAAERRIPLAPSYGMTETAAMVAALRPEQFLAGAGGGYDPMPHVRIELDPTGLVSIEGESVFRGYYPLLGDSSRVEPNDVGAWEAGRLRILGRSDQMIISGGEKVAPAEVEAAILSTGLVADVAVLGVPDPDWGARVVAFVPETLDAGREAALLAGLRSTLAAFKLPKQFVVVRPWPRSGQGKVNRQRLLEAWRTQPGG